MILSYIINIIFYKVLIHFAYLLIPYYSTNKKT
ncbi:hypothetical protein [Enterococcus phage vB_Efs4_KEN02]